MAAAIQPVGPTLCISTCTASAEELAMIWLHVVDNKVHATGRESDGIDNLGSGLDRETIIWWRLWNAHLLSSRERERVKWRFIVRSVCDYCCPRSLVVIIARLSHGERMVDERSLAITCHFSATKLIAGRFKYLILNARVRSLRLL